MAVGNMFPAFNRFGPTEPEETKASPSSSLPALLVPAEHQEMPRAVLETLMSFGI
jgi:hypothetical protein